MENLIYYLSTCDTNRKILKNLPKDKFILCDIKKLHVTESDLDKAAGFFGSYGALLNKRAQKFKGMNENEKPKTEDEIRKTILSDYTFLNRPLIKAGNEWFAGSQPETIEKLMDAIKKL